MERGALLPRLWLGGWFVAALLCARHGTDHHLARTLGRATLAHPLGFDAFGRDLLALSLRASLLSSGFAAFAVAVSSVAAMGAGAFIALMPERPRFLMLRLLDGLLAFPSLLFALAWAAVRGPGWDTLAFALLAGMLPPLCRLMYARSREVLGLEFVTAARGLGAGRLRIVRGHLLPEISALCRVKWPNLFAQALIAEATLSFLGIGAPIGRDTWGSLLAQGKDYLIEAPHLALGVGAPLVLTVLSLQILAVRRHGS